MAKGWKRYGEARVYLMAGSVGLMAIVWSMLFAQDHPSEPDVAASAIEDRSAGTGQRQQIEAPQTRTRGS